MCSVKMRQDVERRIFRATVEAMIAAGFYMIVNDGEEDCQPRPTQDIDVLMESIMSTDMDYLKVYRRCSHADQLAYLGTIDFVYGNDGYDVIADYSLSLEEWLKPVNDLVDSLSD